MKFTLKDYQVDAVADTLTNLRKARHIFHALGDTSQFALTATTGAGKTVMAAAVFEALFYGDESFGFDADPGAVVLWFSDDPSLNEQTRFRLMEASDKLGHSDLFVIQHPFSQEKLQAGKVYFLNTGKLTKSSLLTRGHDASDDEGQLPELRGAATPDLQAYSIWDTIRNTVEDPALTLYLVLDEAHRGMGARQSADKPTIVKRLINGQAGVPPLPVVWGISATVARFEDAMRSAEVAASRLPLPKVVVDSTRVQESGLLKDDIVLDIPAEAGPFDTVLLTRATRKIRESTAAWAAYAAEQGDKDPVVPLLVLQSPNTPDPDDLARALDTVFREWPELAEDAVAHVLGDHSWQQWGPYQVPHISPERVQDAKHVRVLVAKDAISTGWDCPRAEVLMSFRPAKDATHITQLLGRMVRTPLARRIPGNEKLNSVECVLPFFDHKTATNVVKVLMGATDGLPEAGEGRRVLIDPQTMKPNAALPEAVWDALEALPSQSLPRRGAKPVRRLLALAQALATDGLRKDAGKAALAEMHRVLDGCAARYKDQVDEAVSEVWTVQGETIKGRAGSTTPVYSQFAEQADDRSIEAAFRDAGRALGREVAGTYVNHLAGDDDEDLRDAHAKTAALALVDDVQVDLDREAAKLANAWLDTHRVAIKGLSDERQAVYNDIKAMSAQPQRMTITRPKNAVVETATHDSDGNPTPLPTRERHLLCDEDGHYPVGALNNWEVEVLDKEMGRPGALAWYRNPARASQDSLGIPYQAVDDGPWRFLRPDFLFFHDTGDGIGVSVVDPHSHHLSDALPKLRGLAAFAETFASELHRVEAVSRLGDQTRVLDMTDPHVRAAVNAATDAESLYASNVAGNY